MSSEFVIKDDDNGENITHKEHFSVQYVMNDSYGTYKPENHYETIDQVVQHMMTEVNGQVRDVIIRRRNYEDK